MAAPRGRSSTTRGQHVRIVLGRFKARPKRGMHPNLARPGRGFVSSARLNRGQVWDRRAMVGRTGGR